MHTNSLFINCFNVAMSSFYWVSVDPDELSQSAKFETPTISVRDNGLVTAVASAIGSSSRKCIIKIRVRDIFYKSP